MTPRGYEIRLAGQLDAGWSEWFAGFVLHGEGDGTTTLTGAGIDQAALHGALRRVADLGVTLISVHPIGDDPSVGVPELADAVSGCGARPKRSGRRCDGCPRHDPASP